MRELQREDLFELARILDATGAFTEAEVDCAMELLHIVVDQPLQEDYRVAVAEHDGAICGYILYGPVPLTEGNFDIYWIATDPEVQGLGLGRKLMAHAEADAQRRGARLIGLETSSQGNYARTRSFYQRAGYTLESCIRDFYRPGDDRLTYVKRFPRKGN